MGWIWKEEEEKVTSAVELAGAMLDARSNSRLERQELTHTLAYRYHRKYETN